MHIGSRTITVAFSIAALLATSSSQVQAQALTLSAEPNQSQYVPGDTLRVEFTTRATTAPEPLDLYVGIVFADQRTTLFFSSLVPPTWHGTDLHTSAATFVPLHKARQLAAGEQSLPSALALSIPANTPTGTYSILFAATQPDSLTDDIVGTNDLVAYTQFPLVVVAPPVAQTPSTYAPYKALSTQTLADGSLYITGSANVKATALAEAQWQLDTMLRHRPDVTARLRSSGALIGVFAPTEDVCTLPYFADLRGLPNCDAAGGLGGVPGREASGCNERSLLKLASDPFGRGTRQSGENTCLHEIAHLIMNVGLTDVDRERIRTEYARAKTAGIWGSDYIMTNADEYFAEITQAYFCANPVVPTFNHMQGVNCPFSLKAHDPQSYELIDSIFIESSDLR